jgi:hypothetical protein
MFLKALLSLYKFSSILVYVFAHINFTTPDVKLKAKFSL